MSERLPNPDDDSPRGRPTKLTTARLAAAVALTLQGNFRSTVANRIGVGRRTFCRWLSLGRRYPTSRYGTFRRSVLAAEAEFECRAVAAILAAGLDDPRHLEWFLERKYPERWGRFRAELTEFKRRIAHLEARLGNSPDRTGSEPDSPHPPSS